MSVPSRPPRSVIASVRVFRILSRLLPSMYRDRHADEAVQLMAQLAAEAYQRRGTRGVLAVAVPAVLDLIVRLPAEYAGPHAIRVSLDTLGRDITAGLRSLRARPLSTTAAVTTLALGIGLNAAVFSVVDWVLLRPLPYPSPHEIVRVFTADTSTLSESADLTYSEFQTLSRATSLSGAAAFSTATRVMRGQGMDPSHVVVARVAGDLFGTLGVYPNVGRGFGRDEAAAGPPVAVLSETRWRSSLSGDPAIVGRMITIDGQPHTVIGIMPAKRGYPADADIWRPLTEAEREDDDRENVMIARLVSGGTVDGASAELGTLAGTSESRRTAWVEGIQQTQVRDVRATLTALLASSALILLMTCANVAGLLGARSADRTGELAVRRALGASGWRMFRQLLTESTLMAVAGGAAGLLLGRWALDLLVAIAPAAVPRLGEIALDSRVIVAGVAATLSVGILVGVGPALAAARVDLRAGLSGAGSPRTSHRSRTRGVFVAIQSAMAVILVVSAGLLARSLQHLVTIDHGFNPERLVSVVLYLRGDAAGDVRELNRTLLDTAEAVPGVRAAAIALSVPGGATGFRTPVQVEGSGQTSGTPANVRPVTPRYFETTGIPLVDGRVFTPDDRQSGPRVAVVNEAFVRDVLQGSRAVGMRLSTRIFDGVFSIVGVVADVTPAGEADRPAIYVAVDQVAFAGGHLLVRTESDPRDVIPPLVTRLRTAAPTLALDKIQRVAETLEAGRSMTRFNLQLASAFAFLALLLAAIGVYGLTAGEVSARWRELAVRLALGAPRRLAFLTVLRPAAAALGVGALAGLATSLGVGQWMASLLHGVDPADTLTLVLVPLVLGAVGLLAASLAAARILRADPAATLRGD